MIFDRVRLNAYYSRTMNKTCRSIEWRPSLPARRCFVFPLPSELANQTAKEALCLLPRSTRSPVSPIRIRRRRCAFGTCGKRGEGHGASFADSPFAFAEQGEGPGVPRSPKPAKLSGKLLWIIIFIGKLITIRIYKFI